MAIEATTILSIYSAVLTLMIGIIGFFVTRTFRDADRLENYIYEFISVGVLIRQYENDQGMLERYIDQMCFYDRLNGSNHIYMLVEDGKLVSKNIPKDILKRMLRAGISEPFRCLETCPYEPLDVELVKAVRGEGREQCEK